jgi:CspA family cold shock protein
MATENSKYDPLRNPEVDYDRSDLSARGVVLFLVGLLVAGIFIELVLWGMFRFMAKSEVLFPQSQPNPMMSARKLAPAPAPRSVLQNNPAVDITVFPEPRLQTGDATDMNKFLYSEQKTLNPDQPFMDQSGAVHISISRAMKLVEERGLPVRPNATPPEMDVQIENQTQNQTISTKEHGTIKWFNVAKGYGFISRQNGEDVFVSADQANGFRNLQAGQAVQFNAVKGSKGWQAENVAVLSEATQP